MGHCTRAVSSFQQRQREQLSFDSRAAEDYRDPTSTSRTDNQVAYFTNPGTASHAARSSRRGDGDVIGNPPGLSYLVSQRLLSVHELPNIANQLSIAGIGREVCCGRL